MFHIIFCVCYNWDLLLIMKLISHANYYIYNICTLMHNKNYMSGNVFLSLPAALWFLLASLVSSNSTSDRNGSQQLNH